MTKARSELVEFKKNRESGDKKWLFELFHSNGKTSLQQDLLIQTKSFSDRSCKAEIKIDDFPPMSSKKEAAEKMADWLQRLSWAIQSGIKNGVYDD